jgi:hypothetical protein
MAPFFFACSKVFDCTLPLGILVGGWEILDSAAHSSSLFLMPQTRLLEFAGPAAAAKLQPWLCNSS